MIQKTPKPKAPWTTAFPAQARKLRPERSVAGGVKARSGTEERRMEVYKAIRDLFLKSTPFCEVGLCIGFKSRCSGGATEVHHRKGREGLLLFDVKWFFAVCRKCHEYIHDHPAEAKQLGLLV